MTLRVQEAEYAYDIYAFDYFTAEGAFTNAPSTPEPQPSFNRQVSQSRIQFVFFKRFYSSGFKDRPRSMFSEKIPTLPTLCMPP